MLLDKDAILRYGGCFAIALAYVGSPGNLIAQGKSQRGFLPEVGTSQNAAIRKLLHISVAGLRENHGNFMTVLTFSPCFTWLFLGLRCVRWCAASGGHGVAAFGRNQGTGTWTGVWYPRSINICHSNFLSNLKKDQRLFWLHPSRVGLVKVPESPWFPTHYHHICRTPDLTSGWALSCAMCPSSCPEWWNCWLKALSSKQTSWFWCQKKWQEFEAKSNAVDLVSLYIYIYIDILDLAYLNPTWLL